MRKKSHLHTHTHTHTHKVIELLALYSAVAMQYTRFAANIGR
jgi:hypothetical protein